MRYALLAGVYRKLEGLGGRLTVIATLADLFRRTPRELLPKVVYLGQGRLSKRLAPYRAARRPARVEARIEANVWFEPAVVLEIIGAEITLSPIHTAGWGRARSDAGLALRFPRFTGRYRDDKSPEDATTVDEILGMFRSARRWGTGPASP